jgi:hypothetical protein
MGRPSEHRRSVNAKSRQGRHRSFDDPITVDESTLRTLREAADYIVALPEKESRQEHWQIAVHHLMLAAERGGIMMLAQIAMLKAIHHGVERVFNPSRKEHHWGKRKPKRDQGRMGIS